MARRPAVQPKIVAVFVDDEHFAGKPRGQHPFPLGHDGFGRADDGDDVVVVARQLLVQALARLARRVVGDAVDHAAVWRKFCGTPAKQVIRSACISG